MKNKKFNMHDWMFKNLYQPTDEKQPVNEKADVAEKVSIGNLFIVKDQNGHIHLEVGGRSGRMNLGIIGGRQLKEFIAKLLKISKR